MSNKNCQSINNNINNNENELKRDSFSVRICNDLCRLLLSYLSFVDKIRFECASKQFQNCVNFKQNIIEMKVLLESKPSKNALNALIVRDKNKY
jgi:hypothetical protein